MVKWDDGFVHIHALVVHRTHETLLVGTRHARFCGQDAGVTWEQVRPKGMVSGYPRHQLTRSGRAVTALAVTLCPEWLVTHQAVMPSLAGTYPRGPVALSHPW